MTERSVHQEDTMILNVYAANKRTEKQTQQKWTEMKRETDRSVITAEDFNEYFSLRKRTSRNISNSAEERNQDHVTFRAIRPPEVKHTFSGAHGPFTRIDHILALQKKQHI